MKDVLKPVLMFAVAVAVGFYTGFVMQYLWNWFAAPAFHLDPISYWRMCGLVTLFNLINPSGIDSEKRQWDRLFKVLHLCIPESQYDAAYELVQIETVTSKIDMAMSILSKILGNTTCLAIGWAIHTFLI